MKTTMKHVLLASLTIGLILPVIKVQAAETPKQEFRENHPRRAEINARVRNQRRLLKQQLKSGKITQQQYNDQMAALKNVKTQEVADVKANGGYVTKQQQGALNQELNQNREQIKDNNQAANPPATPPAAQ
jgi:hypothetical protein